MRAGAGRFYPSGNGHQSTSVTKRLALGLVCIVTLAFMVGLVGCGGDDSVNPSDSGPDLVTGKIAKPATYDAPAVLPAATTEIEALDGNFTPLLSGVVTDWKTYSRYKYTSSIFADCWGPWEDNFYYAKTRSNVKGVRITYSSCGAYGDAKPTPDFSAPDTNPWGKYSEKSDNWIQDGEGTLRTGDVEFKRYYKTNFTLPAAYIKKHTRWEIVPIEEQDYFLAEGYPSITKTTSRTVGLRQANTEEWGYTLGLEIGADFSAASVKVTATFNQKFSTTITTSKEHTEEISLTGNLLPGTNIIRLQTFREVSTFTLVDSNGDPYPQSIHSPVISVTTDKYDIAWYY